MKKRLNITINEELVKKMKQYAEVHETSISNIVEEHFEEILKPKAKLKKDVFLVGFLKTLPKSKIEFPKDFNWKEEYYKAKAKKYGIEDLF